MTLNVVLPNYFGLPSGTSPVRRVLNSHYFFLVASASLSIDRRYLRLSKFPVANFVRRVLNSSHAIAIYSNTNVSISRVARNIKYLGEFFSENFIQPPQLEQCSPFLIWN
jgi:hypothetical protein